MTSSPFVHLRDLGSVSFFRDLKLNPDVFTWCPSGSVRNRSDSTIGNDEYLLLSVLGVLSKHNEGIEDVV